MLRRELQHILAAGHLRGADLWHFACALYLADELVPPALLALDLRQREVAAASGLEVIAP